MSETLTRLRDVLSGEDANANYERLTPAIRQAIVENLKDTKGAMFAGL